MPSSEGLQGLRLLGFVEIRADDSFAPMVMKRCRVTGEPLTVLSKEMLGSECILGKSFCW